MEEISFVKKVRRKKAIYVDVGVLVVILLGFLIWLQSNVVFLTRQYQTVSGRLLEEPITVKELQEAMSEQKEKNDNVFKEIVLWKQGKRKEIYNPALKRKVEVPTTLVNGSMETTTPMELNYGSYVYKGDKKGCVIDTETAYQLFGDVNIVGKTILCNRIPYQVRGVVKTKNPVFLRQSLKEEKEKFDHVEFVFHKKIENGIQSSKVFLNQYEKGSNVVFLDGILYHTMIERFATFPYWVLLACMTYCFVKWFVGEKKKRIIFICLFSFGIIGYMIGLCLCIGNPFYIPMEFIPTKWSDFDFWVTKWKEIREYTTELAYLVPNTKDKLLIETFYKSLMGITSSTLLILESMRILLKSDSLDKE